MASPVQGDQPLNETELHEAKSPAEQKDVIVDGKANDNSGTPVDSVLDTEDATDKKEVNDDKSNLDSVPGLNSENNEDIHRTGNIKKTETLSEVESDELFDPCLDFKSDPAKMTPEVREKMFVLGQELQKKGKDILALKCYLRCLSGLNGKQSFSHIAQCLRSVAELYYSMEEYDKAVKFIQAEKVYYESELIDSSSIDKEDGFLIYGKATEEESGATEGTSTSTDKNNIDVIRAQEYATLAQLCLDHDQPQMALEYQAKATKLRQKLLGNDHPMTQKSLNTFTVMYAEAGKKQYSESLKKYSEVRSENEDMGEGNFTLRQRKAVKQDEKLKASQSYDEDVDTVAPDQNDGLITLIMLIILFILCFLALMGAGTYLYCRIDTSSPMCQGGKVLAEHYYNRVSYLIYKLIRPSQNV